MFIHIFIYECERGEKKKEESENILHILLAKHVWL
jgi:hypothetical protein